MTRKDMSFKSVFDVKDVFYCVQQIRKRISYFRGKEVTSDPPHIVRYRSNLGIGKLLRKVSLL